MQTLIAGISRLTFIHPVRHGTGGILDGFSSWQAEQVWDRPEKLTAAEKDFTTAHHPMGMLNGEEVGQWVQELHPEADIQTINLARLTQQGILQRLTDTDVLISSPGSDAGPATLIQAPKKKQINNITDSTTKLKKRQARLVTAQLVSECRWFVM